MDAVININYQPELERFYGKHRAGWKYTIDSFKNYEISNNAIHIDSFVDKSFLWGKEHENKLYTTDWIGVIHAPPGNYPNSLDFLFDTSNFIKSLERCRGLFTLSSFLMKHVKEKLPQHLHIPVCTLIHPTETPKLIFSYHNFAKNKRKKIVQIGYTLRNKCSIYKLKIPNKLQKCILPFTSRMQREIAKSGLKGVHKISYLSDNDYDLLLSRNIVFLHLISASASNCIIECIVRNTPILINRLPAVEEYLGKDYPFYFDDLQDASVKAQDIKLIRKTHQYLKRVSKERFSQKYFVRSFLQSEIYKSIE
jgi:hypothetical protein